MHDGGISYDMYSLIYVCLQLIASKTINKCIISI